MKKILVGLLALGSISAFAQDGDTILKCSQFASQAFAEGLVCNLELKGINEATTAPEKSEAMKKANDCFAQAASICTRKYDSNADDVINGMKFSSEAFAQKVACNLELKRIEEATTAPGKHEAMKEANDCLAALSASYSRVMK